MVLIVPAGGEAACLTPSPPSHGERGSQTLEFAMVLPGVVLLLVILVHAGLLGVDLVAVQGLAREAARIAAVDDDEAVRQGLQAAAGRRRVRVVIDPQAEQRVPGEQVTARVELHAAAFAAFGVDVWLPAQATMRVEGP